MKPACFDSEDQFALWMAAEKLASHGVDHVEICADCTPAYAFRMREAGRCEHPETKFFNGVCTTVGKSGYRGVSWHPKTKKFIACKTFGKTQVHLGYFDDPAEAHEAWVEATLRGPAYYGIANGAKPRKLEGAVQLRGDHGEEHPTRKDCV